MSWWYAAPAARAWTCAAPSTAARALHRTLDGYEPTRLVDLPPLADELGVGRLAVKDESSRLGLGAFKILGASWACHRVVAQQEVDLLVTATDGNHGRAVAHAAAALGVAATVFVPAVTAASTVARIEAEGATVVRVDGPYDDAVRAAADHAASEGSSALVQDTAWPGYEQVPAWIVEGYDTLLAEIDEQLGGPPDLVAVPSGVGSLAEAVVRHHRRPGVPHPCVLAVEPTTAACLVASLLAGTPTTVETGDTVMAGLNCGTVSSTAWPVLRDGLDAAVVVTDGDARAAAADLAALGVSSGPSGAAALAGARAVATSAARRLVTGLAPDATVVLLNTEGDLESEDLPRRGR